MVKSSQISFGEMLKAYRKQQGWTQQQLARKLTIHHNTVGAWERGDYLPATREKLLELARCLHLNEIETHYLLDAGLVTITSHWNVPFQRNPFFTGRQEILQQIHTILSGEQDVIFTRLCALNGLAGIGKTQAAIEYAYQHTLDYPAIFWISAETEESLASSFAAIATTLKLPFHHLQTQQEVITMIHSWLTSHHNWLLTFDNVENVELVKRFLPASRDGSLLFTTRLPTLGSLAPCLELHPLVLEESIHVLLLRAGLQFPHTPAAALHTDEEQALRTLAVALDGLPLALDQAAAYIEESRCGFVHFLQLFQKDALQILQKRPSSAFYPHSVEKTLTLAFERLQQQNPIGADLLTLCCFLAPDEIPEELLIHGKSYLELELQEVLSDPFLLNATFRDVLAYTLLRRNTRAETLTIHRLVQTVLKEKLSETTRRTWVERLIRMLNQAFQFEQDHQDIEHWTRYEQLLPHIQVILQQAKQWQLSSSELGSLLRKTATYLFQRARYEYAEELYLYALSIQELILGTNHPDLAPTLTGLADTHHQQGKYQEVEAFYQRAISLVEACLGKEHLQLALPLQGLAFFYQEMSRYKKAEELYQRALHISTQAHGPDHPEVATVLHNLATCYWYEGYYKRAEELYLQVLRIRERTLPPHHPDIGISLNDLAVLYTRLSLFEEAERFCLRNLSFSEQTLGAEHPDVATTLNNLARLYHHQARYGSAEPIYQRALSMRERIFGADHPYTAFLLNNLALLYCDQGKYNEAETLALRALAIYEQKLEAKHHALISPLQNLALLSYKRRRYVEAEILISRALSLRKQTSLPNHPDLASILHLKANISRALGKYEEAELLYQHALSIYQQALGPQHMDLALLTGDLATLYMYQAQWEKAAQLYQDALHRWEHFQQLDHPAYAECLASYAELLRKQQERQRANLYSQRAWEIRIRRRAASLEMNMPASSRDTRGPLRLTAPEDDDLFAAFLQQCCVLSSQAACLAADLWQVYQQWVQAQGQVAPLSRQAFTFHLKMKGCRPGRTNAHRLWHGIELKVRPFRDPNTTRATGRAVSHPGL